MAELAAGVDEQRLRRMEANTGPELYELLVVRRGWSAERFGKPAAEQMIAALLPPEPRA
jgi:hypothetical protein